MFQERDVKITVSLLRLLTRGGADVDVQRNNGEVALHTAARWGPFMALWILLLSQATHDIRDRRLLTPESAAIQAGNEDALTLLSTWPVAKLKYRHSEFVQEWMKFLCDPDANLDTDLTAKEVLAHVRMEEHEEATAVRARGGHLLVDEIITGPVLSAEQRTRAKILGFSASDSVSTATTTLEDSTSTSTSSAKPCPNSSHNGPGSPSKIRRGNDEKRDGVYGKKAEDGREEGKGENIKKCSEGRQTTTKSKLGKEIDVFLAQARDETAGVVDGGMAGESTAHSRFVAKQQLEARRSRWHGPRDNGKDPPTGGGGPGSLADPFGRPMTTNQRRCTAALEIAQDGG